MARADHGRVRPVSSPFWLRALLAVAIVWLAVAVIHGVNRALTGRTPEVSLPRR